MTGADVKPKILQIVADGSPGGGTTHVLQILRGMREKCSMGLITQRDSYLLSEARSQGIPAFGMDFFRSRLDPGVPFRLRKIVHDFGAWVVHAHGGRAAFFYSLAFVRVPMVYTVHGYHFLHKTPVTRRLALCAEHLALRQAKEVIFVSKHDARVAKVHGIQNASTRSIVINNGISLLTKSILRPRQSKHIGFVGRLEDPKDPFLFLDIMERLPGYTATVVGGGTLEDEMRIEIGRRNLSRVRMTGSLPHLETLQVLSTFSILVMTSRWEAFGYSAVEAMRFGVPVVATNVGGLGEIMEDGESGILVEERSAVELARAVRRLEEDKQLRGRIIENGRRRVCERFSEKRMLDGIWEVYERVADG